MDRKYCKNSQAGFSLLEVVIALGLLGVVAVMFASMSSNMSKLQADVERRQDEQELRVEIGALLGNKEYCTASLGRVFDNNNPDNLVVQKLVYTVDGSRVDKFIPSQVYGKIRIDRMFLTARPGDSAAVLNLEYTRLNNTSIPAKTLNFPITAEWGGTSSTTLVNCSSAGTQDSAEFCNLMDMEYSATTRRCVPRPAQQGSQTSYTTIKTSNSNGYWGDWADSASYCGGNGYVVGLQTRIEGPQNSGAMTNKDDDTAMNAVRLICGSNHPTLGLINVHTIKSKEGPWGDWAQSESIEYCPWGTYAKGFQTRVEKSQGGGRNEDDTAMNTVRLICSDSAQTSITSYQGQWGDWGTKAFCPEGKYICGFKTRVEKDLGGGKLNKGNDDTALNGIEMYCCSK